MTARYRFRITWAQHGSRAGEPPAMIEAERAKQEGDFWTFQVTDGLDWATVNAVRASDVAEIAREDLANGDAHS